MKNILYDQGEVYRYAGDEFVCLILRDLSKFSPAQFKRKITEKINIDVPFQGLSLGLASHPKDGVNADDLISFADQSMYTEKRAKKTRQ